MTLFVTILSSWPLWWGKFSQGQVKPAKVYSCVFWEGLQSWMFKWLYLQHGCPLENSVAKEWSWECWRVNKKTTYNFLIAQRCGLLQYVLGKIVVVANTLCRHKLYKIQCLRLTWNRQFTFFIENFYMEMQRSFKAFNTTLTVIW